MATDRYLRWTNTGPGRFLSRHLGLPRPVPLHRWSAQHPTLEGGPLLLLTAGRTACNTEQLATVLGESGLSVHRTASAQTRYAAVVVDATGATQVADLAEVHGALHPVVRSLTTCGRVVVLGTRPGPDDPRQAAAQQALEGLTRSLGKELGKGRTVQLVRLLPRHASARSDEQRAPGEKLDVRAAASTLRFLLSPKSAYVSGQVVEVAERTPTQGAEGVGEAAADPEGEAGQERPRPRRCPGRLP